MLTFFSKSIKKTNDILIAAVSGQFKEYHDLGIEDKDLKTIELLSVNLLTEKLEDDLSTNESFGYSVSCSNNIIAVGSPKYIAPVVHGPTLDFTGPEAGMVRLFRKMMLHYVTFSFNVIFQQRGCSFAHFFLLHPHLSHRRFPFTTHFHQVIS